MSELAREAGLTLQTTSAHLVKLQNGNLVMAREQGRHCYFQLAPPGVAAALEALMGLVAERGHVRTRIGPRDETPRVEKAVLQSPCRGGGCPAGREPDPTRLPDRDEHRAVAVATRPRLF